MPPVALSFAQRVARASLAQVAIWRALVWSRSGEGTGKAPRGIRAGCEGGGGDFRITAAVAVGRRTDAAWAPPSRLGRDAEFAPTAVCHLGGLPRQALVTAPTARRQPDAAWAPHSRLGREAEFAPTAVCHLDGLPRQALVSTSIARRQPDAAWAPPSRLGRDAEFAPTAVCHLGGLPRQALVTAPTARRQSTGRAPRPAP